MVIHVAQRSHRTREMLGCVCSRSHLEQRSLSGNHLQSGQAMKAAPYIEQRAQIILTGQNLYCLKENSYVKVSVPLRKFMCGSTKY